VMTGQVDVGWSVAPFNLDPLEKGQIRLLAKASDIERIRGQTIRVMITNARNLEQKKDLLARYMRGYRETLDWMYSDPEVVKKYVEFSGIPEAAVRRMLKDFMPKESLQMDRIEGLAESLQDAVQFKFLSAPLTDQQLTDVIRIPAN
jgi:ABC-type nitrate/sulfonate/bicarbonate transport system substrate-binding protein